MSNSIQHKLGRVRPPRVQITYDVEIGDAIQQKELPFVVGIFSDLAGDTKSEDKLKERKFVSIDLENFDDVMASVGPTLDMAVTNAIKGDDSKFKVELKFDSMDDFGPMSLIEQVPELRDLFAARMRLSDLLGKLDGNDELHDLLRDLADDENGLKSVVEDTKGGDSE